MIHGDSYSDLACPLRRYCYLGFCHTSALRDAALPAAVRAEVAAAAAAETVVEEPDCELMTVDPAAFASVASAAACLLKTAGPAGCTDVREASFPRTCLPMEVGLAQRRL